MRSRSVLAAALIVCLASGCQGSVSRPGATASTFTTSSATSPPAASSTASSSVAMPATTSATAAALRAGTVLFAADTAIDASFNATWLRHRDLLTTAYAQQLAGLTVQAGGDAGWQVWASHKAVLAVTAQLIDDDQPADTATTALRHLLLVLTPHGAAGWHGPAVQMGVVLILSRVSVRWLVGGVHVDV